MSLFRFARVRTAPTDRSRRLLDALRVKQQATLLTVHAVPNVQTAQQRASRILFLEGQS